MLAIRPPTLHIISSGKLTRSNLLSHVNPFLTDYGDVHAHAGQSTSGDATAQATKTKDNTEENQNAQEERHSN